LEPSDSDEKAQRSGVREFLIMVGLLAVVLGLLVMVVAAMQRAATDVKHVEHAYDTLSLSRTSIGDSGTFWGAYAAYGAACLFLFAWLGRFPILDALWSSLLAALMAVIFVFAPIFFFVVSIHTVAKAGSPSISCGSWLYPSASSSPHCVKAWASASRWGLTFAVAGILIPIMCMFNSMETKRNQEKTSGSKSREGEPGLGVSSAGDEL
jgi:hypothetical protein